MDLKQNKLSKTEWESIEKLVGDSEKKILSMIVAGYDNVNIRYNDTKTLNAYIRFDTSAEMDYFLFKKYFAIGNDYARIEIAVMHAGGKFRKVVLRDPDFRLTSP